LIFARRLVSKLERVKLLEKHPGLVAFQQLDDLPGRKHFETLHVIRQVRRRCNQVKMVLQNDIAIKKEMTVLLEESPGIEDDLDGLGSRENRHPTHDRAGHEV